MILPTQLPASSPQDTDQDRPRGDSASTEPDSARDLRIMGTVPVWVLSGLRLERVGQQRLPNGWVVGVYQMEAAEFEPEEPASSN